MRSSRRCGRKPERFSAWAPPGSCDCRRFRQRAMIDFGREFSASSPRNQTNPANAVARRPKRGGSHGQKIKKTGKTRAPPALAGLVRQSRQPEHDGDLPRAVPEFRPHPRGIGRRQAHHRHRPDRLGSFALQPPPPPPPPPPAPRHPPPPPPPLPLPH